MAWEPEPPRRPKVLTLRLSNAEREMLEQEAQRVGENNISNVVRRIMRSYFVDQQGQR